MLSVSDCPIMFTLSGFNCITFFQIKNFECEQCGKRFDKTRNLVNHIQNVHKDKNVNNGKINKYENNNQSDDLQNLDSRDVTADNSSAKPTIKSNFKKLETFKIKIQVNPHRTVSIVESSLGFSKFCPLGCKKM
jgi:hypothetical protein